MPRVTNIEERTTSKGTPMATLTLKGDDRKPNMFPSHSLWGNIKIGDEVTLVQKGEYWNVYDPKPKKKGSGNVAEAMQRKEASIKSFQSSKEKSIMLASSIRMATDLAIAQGLTKRVELKEAIRAWRSWLILEWDNDDITNEPPF